MFAERSPKGWYCFYIGFFSREACRAEDTLWLLVFPVRARPKSESVCMRVRSALWGAWRVKNVKYVLGKKEILSTGLKKGKGWVPLRAPFLSYGTKYIQACECARKGDVGPRKITKYISQSEWDDGCAVLFCAPVFSLRRLWQIETRNNHTRAFSRGELLGRPHPNTFFTLRRHRRIQNESCSISFPSTACNIQSRLSDNLSRQRPD